MEILSVGLLKVGVVTIEVQGTLKVDVKPQPLVFTVKLTPVRPGVLSSTVDFLPSNVSVVLHHKRIKVFVELSGTLS